MSTKVNCLFNSQKVRPCVLWIMWDIKCVLAAVSAVHGMELLDMLSVSCDKHIPLKGQLLIITMRGRNNRSRKNRKRKRSNVWPPDGLRVSYSERLLWPLCLCLELNKRKGLQSLIGKHCSNRLMVHVRPLHEWISLFLFAFGFFPPPVRMTYLQLILC